jgi:signal transduction histidine kinase
MKITETEEAVRFIVEDTGTGMAEEYRALMFEPFTKVNDLSEGLGLGLPLAKRHAENLGGDLWLDESYDKGCRFILELPKYR